jgi:ATP-dependent Clp protease ATP-binding subunit ClpB
VAGVGGGETPLDGGVLRVACGHVHRHLAGHRVGIREAPPGYVGYEEGGQLTEAIRRRPYSVVLFDEVEKAHPDVFNALLQILDDGRLTDGQGRTVDCKNTVLILTSNCGSEFVQQRHMGFRAAEHATVDDHEMRAAVMNAVHSQFRPEFINRLDDIVIFHALTRPQLARIVEIQLGRLRALLAARKIELELSPAAEQLLGDAGFDPAFGARPLKRVIQHRVQNPLAEKILAGEIRDGERVVVEVAGEGLVFRTDQP